MILRGGAIMQREPASNRAIWSLVLGILGLILCGLLAPFAWWLGAAELRDIKAGLSPDSGQGLATAGMVLGIIGTVFFGNQLLRRSRLSALLDWANRDRISLRLEMNSRLANSVPCCNNCCGHNFF